MEALLTALSETATGKVVMCSPADMVTAQLALLAHDLAGEVAVFTDVRIPQGQMIAAIWVTPDNLDVLTRR